MNSFPFRGRPTPALVLLLAVVPLHARTTTWARTTIWAHTSLDRPAAITATNAATAAPSMLDSLRDDAALHPSDYVTFETAAAARRFLAKHLDVSRETDPTMISRGILGYWEGKTVAVVPSLAPPAPLRTSR